MNKDSRIAASLAIFIALLGAIVASCGGGDETTTPDSGLAPDSSAAPDSGETPVATSMELLSGDGQTEEVETLLPVPVSVVVKDQFGNGFAGTEVSFDVTEGEVSSATAITDAEGEASATWTLGPTIGYQNLVVAAFAANGTTPLSGSPFTLTAAATTPTTVTDVEGNTYPVVVIGDQIWMAKNLEVGKYPNGTDIPYVEDDSTWGDLPDDETADAYCLYGNDPDSEYGGLYTYAAATKGDNSGADVQGVCPANWHLPSDAEWQELEMHLGMGSIDASTTGWRGTDEGGKLKEEGTVHWNSPNTGATNETGFTGLPGGARYASGQFSNVKSSGGWWSATQSDETHVLYRLVGSDRADVLRNIGPKSYGLSVRCVRD